MPENGLGATGVAWRLASCKQRSQPGVHRSACELRVSSYVVLKRVEPVLANALKIATETMAATRTYFTPIATHCSDTKRPWSVFKTCSFVSVLADTFGRLQFRNKLLTYR